MKVRELANLLKRCPQDYEVEFKVGTDHWVVDEAKPDKPHKRTEYWRRRRRVIYLG